MTEKRSLFHDDTEAFTDEANALGCQIDAALRPILEQAKDTYKLRDVHYVVSMAVDNLCSETIVRAAIEHYESTLLKDERPTI